MKFEHMKGFCIMTMITRKQFDVLEVLADSKEALSQRDLEAKTHYSLGTINHVVKELKEMELASGGKITEKGLNALKPYEVKRAIFVAAGFGSRMAPITLNTPKPLVRVRGMRIIDRLIDSCLNVGIQEIYVVRGYLSEQFDQLLYKYPMIKFLENSMFNEANNISSALVAKDLLSDAYVFEADLLLYNPKIIKKYHYCSNFLAIQKKRTDDWCFEVRNRVITEEKIGGENCWQMVGISFWNEKDGKELSRDIDEVFHAPGGKERYWEQVPLVYKKEKYSVEVRECFEDDIVEIDTYKELATIDSSYEIKM